MKLKFAIGLTATVGILAAPTLAGGAVTPIEGPYYEECDVTNGVALQGDGAPDLLPGTQFVDLLRGGNGPDMVVGEGGADCLFGEQGTDIVKGGPGNDLVSGAGQGDKLFGGSGDDILRGGANNDQLLGGPGADTFNCGPGIDVVYKAKPIDTVKNNCERVNTG